MGSPRVAEPLVCRTASHLHAGVACCVHHGASPVSPSRRRSARSSDQGRPTMSLLELPARPRGTRPADRRAVYLLDSDPDLGRRLTPSRLTLARRTLRAPVVPVDRGPWTPDPASAWTGVLILDGLLVRDVVVADEVA